MTQKEVIMSPGATLTTHLSDLVPICTGLPAASIEQVIGATRVISHAGGHMSQHMLAQAVHFDDEQIVAAIEFLTRLGVIEVPGSEVALTTAGKRVASAKILARKRVFAELATRLPVIREILHLLAREADRSLPRETLMDKIGARSCPSDAALQFDHVVAWGRYAGLFSYDAAHRKVTLS
jgi:NitT/TauT family transport system ATP-binding protein